MASQQAQARPQFQLASLSAPAQPSNQVPQPRPSFMTRSTTFGQNFWLPKTAQPPPSAAVAPPPLPAIAAQPAAAPRAAVVPVISSFSSSLVPPLFQPRIFSTPMYPMQNSHVPKLVSPSPTPSPPPSPFQASLGVSITAPNSFPKINKSHPSNSPSQSPKTSPISQPPSPPCKIIKKHYSDSKDSGVKLITISGDNEGATVKLSSSRKNGCSIEISYEEGNSNQNPGVGFEIKSGVQGLNNSILYNSSLTRHSPGVHLSAYSKANGATN